MDAIVVTSFVDRCARATRWRTVMRGRNIRIRPTIRSHVVAVPSYAPKRLAQTVTCFFLTAPCRLPIKIKGVYRIRYTPLQT
jgi:hypothetical protein